MKKSTIYKFAQYAVINSASMVAETKAEILRELIHAEDLALFAEKREEEDKRKVVANNETV